MGLAVGFIFVAVTGIALAYLLAADDGGGDGPDYINPVDNAILWSQAHTALIQFVGEGMATFGREPGVTVTEEELSAMTGYVTAFGTAVTKLAGVNPPPEQEIPHNALLPIYQEIQTTMESIRDLLLTEDPYDEDLEWNHLAILLEREAGLIQLLAPPDDGMITTTTATEPVVITTLPTISVTDTEPILSTDIPPKPENLAATDAEYYLMYRVAEQWEFEFNPLFSEYAEMGIENGWDTIWIGIEGNESQRIYFERTGDSWQPAPLPGLPENMPPKPANLAASDADYLLMYDLYTSWGYDFIAGFTEHSRNAEQAGWTAWWIGSATDTQHRLNFIAADGGWAAD